MTKQNKSYYDWDMEFKAKKHDANSIGICNETFQENGKIQRETIEKMQKDEETNTLGLKKSDFKKFLSEWEKKNF